MENEQLLKEVTAKAKTWLGDGYDAETRAEVQRMLDNPDKTELIESFYKDLEFGLKYGFLIEELRLLTRGIVIIGKDQKVKYVEYVPEITAEPDYEKAMEALRQLS